MEICIDQIQKICETLASLTALQLRCWRFFHTTTNPRPEGSCMCMCMCMRYAYALVDIIIWLCGNSVSPLFPQTRAGPPLLCKSDCDPLLRKRAPGRESNGNRPCACATPDTHERPLVEASLQLDTSRRGIWGRFRLEWAD